MILKKGDNKQISIHFSSKELFSKSPGVTEHYLHDGIPQVLEHFRNSYGPIRVTSTFRTKAQQLLLTGKSSAHTLGLAVDFQFIENNTKSLDEIAYFLTEGLDQDLKDLGVGGVGLYDTFMHIDMRSTKTYNHGTIQKDGSLWALWNNRNRTINQNIGAVKKKLNFEKYTRFDEDGNGLSVLKIGIAFLFLVSTGLLKKLFSK